MRFGSGQTVRRIEDEALVRGQGRYTDDEVMAGQLTLMFLRSPHAHARILRIAAAAHHRQPEAADAAFAAAAHTVRLDLVNQRLAPSPMEPRATVARVEADTGRLQVSISSQMPTGVRDTLVALIPGLSTEQVRVTVGDVGGGFGM